MTALDTNIIVRYITQGDPNQFARARDLIRGTLCYVPDTVILETVWVLKSVYGNAAGDIVTKLSAFFGLPTIRVRDSECLKRALTWYIQGMDFGDALHLSTCQHLSHLKTFDQRFIKRASGKGTCVVEPV